MEKPDPLKWSYQRGKIDSFKVEDKKELERLKCEIIKLESMIENSHAPSNTSLLTNSPAHYNREHCLTPASSEYNVLKFKNKGAKKLITDNSAFQIEEGTLPKAISEYTPGKKKSSVKY